MKPENTNPCERFEPLLSAHLLGELPREETEDVAAHVLVCNACQDELELLSRTVNVLARGVPSESAMGDATPGDAALGDAARRRILEAASRGGADSRGDARRSRTAGYWLCGLAAAALIAVGVVSFLQPARAPVSGPDAGAVLPQSSTASVPAGGAPVELARADLRMGDKNIPDINGTGTSVSPGLEWSFQNEVESRKSSSSRGRRSVDPTASTSLTDGLEVAGIPGEAKLLKTPQAADGSLGGKIVEDNFRVTADGRWFVEKDSGTSLENQSSFDTDFTVKPGSAEELAARRMVDQVAAPGARSLGLGDGADSNVPLGASTEAEPARAVELTAALRVPAGVPAPETRQYSLTVGEQIMARRGLPASGPEAARPALVATPEEAPAPVGESELFFRGDTNADLLARAGARSVSAKAKPAPAGDPDSPRRLYRSSDGLEAPHSSVAERKLFEESTGLTGLDFQNLARENKTSDGKDLTRNAQSFVDEYAPGLDPIRFSRESLEESLNQKKKIDLPGTSAEPGSAGGVPEAKPALPPQGLSTLEKLTELVSSGTARDPRMRVPPLVDGQRVTGPLAPPKEVALVQEADAFGAQPAAGGAAAAALPATQPAAPATTRPDGALYWKTRVDDFLTRLDRLPGETPDNMFFRYWGDNPFVEASTDAQSTFGVDVDTASYTLARNYLTSRGVLPPKEAIRTEEFINYFKARGTPPTEEGRTFAIHVEGAPSPFAHEAEYKLLRVVVKGREVSREKRKSCSLVFVIDTSGSMRRENRLETVKEGLRLLVRELDEGDTIGIVAFDREARTVLEPVPASEKERILDAISLLEPRQNTNVAAGLEMGYAMAAAHLLKDGSNRVILCSDGVANTGVTDVGAMLERVRGERQRGVYLTCVGVGMGNLNDALLEQLANRGNGHCVYVDRLDEARKVFVDNLTGTLEAIARDVKIQVELDPERVLRYRLLGYENRSIADASFRDNTVDAGEVGAGHEVTALYELKLRPQTTGKLATVRVRHLTVEHGEAQEIEQGVDVSALKSSFVEASPRFQLAACVAELAEVLRESYWARGSSLERAAGMVQGMLGLAEREGGQPLGSDPDVVELVALMRKADALVRRRQAEQDEVARTVDAIKDNYYLRARIDTELQARAEANRGQLDDLIRQNNDLRGRLESLLSR